jgi:hypothetical protein
MAVFIVALVPRLYGLGTFFSSDEILWFQRSMAFWDAISAGEWARTYQQVHPNVTTMWVAGFLLKLAGRMGVNLADPHWIPVGRMAVVLITAGACGALVAMLCDLVPRRAALAAGLVVALDPFFLAHSRTLHTYSVAAAFVALAYVALLIACRHELRARYIVLAGGLAGLAGLTSVTAALLVPASIGTLLIAVWTRQRHRIAPLGNAWTHWLWAVVLWGVAGIIVVVALWPAMWVQPVKTLRRVVVGAVWGIETPHGGEPSSEAMEALYASNPAAGQFFRDYLETQQGEPHTYFMGEMVWTPGPLFYPLTWLYRSTPLTLLLLPLSCAMMLLRVLRRTWRQSDSVALSLLALAILSMLALSVSAKQFQRYLQTTVVLTGLVTGIYLMDILDLALARMAERNIGSSVAKRPAIAAAASILLIGLLHWLPYVSSHPYEIAYYQPLLGGHAAARDIFLLGTGEGLDGAASYLNRITDGRARVSTRYSVFMAPFYRGEIESVSPMGLYADHSTDYVVVYINEIQRHMSPELDTLLAGREPEHVVTVNGLEYVWLYHR